MALTKAQVEIKAGKRGPLSFFDLQEGVEYHGFSGGSKTTRKFKVINGVLHNDSGYANQYTTVCTHIPSDCTFSRVMPLPEVDHKGRHHGLNEMVEGHVYKHYDRAFARHRNQLISVNPKTMTALKPQPTTPSNLPLSKFECIGKLKKAR